MTETEVDKLCRCCLSSADASVSLLTCSHTSYVLFVDMLRECCSLDTTEGDGMPSKICLSCSNKLSSSYKFREMCLRSNEILIDGHHASDLMTIKTEMDTGPVEFIEPTSLMDEHCLNKDIKEETDVLNECTEEKVDLEYALRSLIFSDDENYGIENPVKAENSEINESPLTELPQKSIRKKKPKVTTKHLEENLASETSIRKRKTITNHNRRKNVCNLCNRNCKNAIGLKDHINWVHKGIKYYCNTCKKFYTSEQHHKYSNHGRSWHCERCGLVFDTKMLYHVHLNAVHRQSGPQNCNECDGVFTSKPILLRHKESVHGTARYVCEYCLKKFTRKDKFNDHIKRHSKEKPYRCNMCSLMFTTRDKLNVHKLRHAGERNFKCDHCSSTFKTKQDLCHHMSLRSESLKHHATAICPKLFEHLDYTQRSLNFSDDENNDIDRQLNTENLEGHENSLNELPQELSKKKKVKVIKKNVGGNIAMETSIWEEKIITNHNRRKNVCHLCNRNCKNAIGLKDHINWVHKGIKYFCNICKKFYTSEQFHKLSNHSGSRHCERCGLAFGTRMLYHVHMNAVHRRSGPQYCDECDGVFTSKPGLIRHKESAHGTARYVCQYCSKKFTRKDKLNDHIKRHTKEKAHRCNICSLMFTSHGELKVHKERHTTERNFQCDHCSATFKTKPDVRGHMRLHSESLKRYACAICSKLFHRSDHRNVHQRNVHKLDETRADTFTTLKL